MIKQNDKSKSRIFFLVGVWGWEGGRRGRAGVQDRERGWQTDERAPRCII